MKRNILLFLISLMFCATGAAEGINIGYCGGQVSKQGCMPVSGEGWVHASAVFTADMLSIYIRAATSRASGSVLRRDLTWIPSGYG